MQFVTLQTLSIATFKLEKTSVKNYEITTNLRHQQNSGWKYFNL